MPATPNFLATPKSMDPRHPHYPHHLLLPTPKFYKPPLPTPTSDPLHLRIHATYAPKLPIATHVI